jgi:ATP-binding cassette subfamily F protein 3
VQSRVKKIDKIERIEIPPEERLVTFAFSEPPRSGDDVVVMDGLAKEWPLPQGGVTPVFSCVSGIIRRGAKVAVVGVNGAGKSTFLKVLAGQTEPTSGRVTLGANVELGYFSQHAMEVLEPKKTIFETIQEVLPLANRGVIMNLLGAFLFSGDAVDKRIENLSGGEKSRVVLATLFARPVNFLVLDEPTNHLDIRSREILLDTLQKFSGTVVLVSHDRHFLRSLVDRVIEVDHGEMRTYEGNYQYYQQKVHGEA